MNFFYLIITLLILISDFQAVSNFQLIAKFSIIDIFLQNQNHLYYYELKIAKMSVKGFNFYLSYSIINQKCTSWDIDSSDFIYLLYHIVIR